MTIEHERLTIDGPTWKRWGPYLAERAWGTVREDYSAGGTAWDSFPHDHARSRAYRWNEDGLLGICDDQQRLGRDESHLYGHARRGAAGADEHASRLWHGP